MIERTLASDGLKPASFDLECSVATVALHLKRVLGFMGLACTISRAPALLIFARHAAAGMRIDARFAALDDALDVISAPRPDLAIEPLLTPVESTVVRHFVEGKSYAEIAGGRARSVRTVANQLSAVYRKLGVSGRLGLLRRLAVAAQREEQIAAAS
jgi:DNA-binding CsgD family transcriptional regulator